MTEIRNIPTSQIIPGDNDRQKFDQAALEELAASIQAHGLAQPVTARLIGHTCPDCGELVSRGEAIPCYQIVAGERRFRAMRDVLKAESVPCIVRELDDEAASAIMLAENTGRQDLDPIEEAQAYQKRVERFGWTEERLAEIAGVSPDLVKRRRSLLSLVPEVQHLISNGHFPLGHAELMAPLDPNRQRIAVRVYRESKGMMPKATFRRVVSELLEQQQQDGLFDLEAFWMQAATNIAELPRRGKRALVDVPTRSDLPPVLCGPTASASSILQDYITTLESAGYHTEAATLGTVFTSLVHSNFMALPA